MKADVNPRSLTAMQLAAGSHALPTKEYPTEDGVHTYIIATVLSEFLVQLAHCTCTAISCD